MNEDRRGGEGVWLLIFLALLVGAKPAADAATPSPPAKPKTHHARVATPPPAPAPACPGRSGPAADIPCNYLRVYDQAARTCPGLSWGVLAGIGKVESDHGRSRAPGVVSGVNSFGCCSGPMQFNIRNGPPSTWDRYGRGGNVYDPRAAIPAAARMLCANGIGAPNPPGDPCPGVVGTAAQHQAVMAYNHACWYVDQVLTLAGSYQVGGGG